MSEEEGGEEASWTRSSGKLGRSLDGSSEIEWRIWEARVAAIDMEEEAEAGDWEW